MGVDLRPLFHQANAAVFGAFLVTQWSQEDKYLFWIASFPSIEVIIVTVTLQTGLVLSDLKSCENMCPIVALW